MNPVYSPGSSGVPYANAKGIGYPAGFPVGYAAAPAYSPNMYPGANPTFQTGYTPGTPYKVSCSPTSGAVPPCSSSPNPYQTAVYPVRSAYPQQSMPSKALLHTTSVCSPSSHHSPHHSGAAQRHASNGLPCSDPSPRGSGVTMGMVARTTMAISADTLLTAHSPTPVAPHPVTVPTYRAPGTPTYSFVPPQW